MIEIAWRQRTGVAGEWQEPEEQRGEARGNVLHGVTWQVADDFQSEEVGQGQARGTPKKNIDIKRVNPYHGEASASASGFLPLRLSPKMIQPPLRPVIQPSAIPMITDRVGVVLDSLFPLLDHAARRYFAPVKRLEVKGFRSYEDDSQEVVVTLYVELPVDAALEFWDRVNLLVGDWTDKLPSELARISTERLSVAVRWDWDHDAFSV